MLGGLSMLVLAVLQDTLQFSIPSNPCNSMLDGNIACRNAQPIRNVKVLIEDDLAANSGEARQGINLEWTNVSPKIRTRYPYTYDNFYHPWSFGNIFDIPEEQRAQRSKKHKHLQLIPDTENNEKFIVEPVRATKPRWPDRPYPKPPRWPFKPNQRPAKHQKNKLPATTPKEKQEDGEWLEYEDSGNNKEPDDESKSKPMKLKMKTRLNKPGPLLPSCHLLSR